MEKVMKKQSKPIDLQRFARRRAPMIARWSAMVLLLGLLVSACMPPAAPTQLPPAAPTQPASTVAVSSGQFPLENTNWVLQSYGDPNNPTPAEKGVTVNALFSPAKSLSGSSGCNTYTARYAIQGNTMRIDQPKATYTTCPQGMEQEGVYLSALVSVISYQINGSSLEIVYDKGKGLLKYSASAP
jgi:heat shock protein HslJ